MTVMRFLAVVAALCATGFTLPYVLTPIDDSDAGFFARSGADVVKDYKTGCEYLARGRSITARLDASGKHICQLNH